MTNRHCRVTTPQSLALTQRPWRQKTQPGVVSIRRTWSKPGAVSSVHSPNHRLSSKPPRYVRKQTWICEYRVHTSSWTLLRVDYMSSELLIMLIKSTALMIIRLVLSKKELKMLHRGFEVNYIYFWKVFSSVYFQTLLLSPKSWSSPRLHALPEQYDQIFQLYRKLNCITCNSLPREPTVCLACARLVCFKEQCCNEHNTLECIQVGDFKK